MFIETDLTGCRQRSKCSLLIIFLCVYVEIIQVNSVKEIVIRLAPVDHLACEPFAEPCSAISELIFFVSNRFVSKSFR